MKKITYILMLAAIFLLTACTTSTGSSTSVGVGDIPNCNGTTLNIVSGSENKIYAQEWQNWGCENNINLAFHWKGSVDIARILSNESEYSKYDAVMAANSLWHRLGDVDNILRDEISVYSSPIVFVSVPRWEGNTLELETIVSAAENKQITFGITSATQSNSGNNMFMAILDLARKQAGYIDEPTLTEEMMYDPAVSDYVERVLAQVNRGSASTGFLGEVFVKQYPNLTGVFVYETIAKESIDQLILNGIPDSQLPRVYYVLDAVAEANAPLARIEHSGMNDKKREAFAKFQEWLTSDEGQLMLFEHGARVQNLSEYSVEDVERVFSPSTTGIDVNLVLMSAPIPRDGNTIRAAMNFYQSDWRRASCTALVTDHSGSMNDNVSLEYDGQVIRTSGGEQLNEALRKLLNQDLAATYYLQATNNDYMVVVPFTDRVDTGWIVQINDISEYPSSLNNVLNVGYGGGTDMYSGMIVALDYMIENCTAEQLPSIIVMTDGKSGGSFKNFEQAWRSYTNVTGYSVPVFSITFGNADEYQLEKLAELTYGEVFNGSSDLWGAFAKAKGNN